MSSDKTGQKGKTKDPTNKHQEPKEPAPVVRATSSMEKQDPDFRECAETRDNCKAIATTTAVMEPPQHEPDFCNNNHNSEKQRGGEMDHDAASTQTAELPNEAALLEPHEYGGALDAASSHDEEDDDVEAQLLFEEQQQEQEQQREPQDYVAEAAVPPAGMHQQRRLDEVDEEDKFLVTKPDHAFYDNKPSSDETATLLTEDSEFPVPRVIYVFQKVPRRKKRSTVQKITNNIRLLLKTKRTLDEYDPEAYRETLVNL